MDILSFAWYAVVGTGAIVGCLVSLAVLAFIINGVIWSIRAPYNERRLEQSKAEIKARMADESFEQFHANWMRDMKRLITQGEADNRGFKIYRQGEE
jgi:hypothetical protein